MIPETIQKSKTGNRYINIRSLPYTRKQHHPIQPIKIVSIVTITLTWVVPRLPWLLPHIFSKDYLHTLKQINRHTNISGKVTNQFLHIHSFSTDTLPYYLAIFIIICLSSWFEVLQNTAERNVVTYRFIRYWVMSHLWMKLVEKKDASQIGHLPSYAFSPWNPSVQWLSDRKMKIKSSEQ